MPISGGDIFRLGLREAALPGLLQNKRASVEEALCFKAQRQVRILTCLIIVVLSPHSHWASMSLFGYKECLLKAPSSEAGVSPGCLH